MRTKAIYAVTLNHSADTILVLDLGKTVKQGLEKEGMIGWQYAPVGVSDAITMGSEGCRFLY